MCWHRESNPGATWQIYQEHPASLSFFRKALAGRSYRVPFWNRQDSRIKTTLLSVSFLFFYLLLISACPVWAETRPEIKDIFLAENKGNLCLSFRLTNGLTDQIEKIIQSGIPVRYVFDIRLKRHRMILKEEVRHIELRRMIVFDNIRNEYIVSSYYPHTRVISANRLGDAENYLFRVENIEIVPMARLAKKN